MARKVKTEQIKITVDNIDYMVHVLGEYTEVFGQHGVRITHFREPIRDTKTLALLIRAWRHGVEWGISEAQSAFADLVIEKVKETRQKSGL